MSEIILETKKLCKTYSNPQFSNTVLQNIDLSIKEGEFVSIMGPSGSGKSTLLYMASAMDSITSGEVIIDGQNLTQLNEKQLSAFRLKKMGFVFQQMYMISKLCVMDNIVLPGYQAKLKSREEINQRAFNLMKSQGIEDIALHEISEVSGGQLQRACLCRALINNPKILFADEPTGALNSKASLEVIGELLKANKQGTTVLMVTHSEKVAAASSRILYLMDGHIQGELNLGRPESVTQLSTREKTIKNWLNEMGW